ncbi:MAG: protein kinase [Planctomyces sp.]|nr:protein kinase [Planctomyces sp.]
MPAASELDELVALYLQGPLDAAPSLHQFVRRNLPVIAEGFDEFLQDDRWLRGLLPSELIADPGGSSRLRDEETLIRDDFLAAPVERPPSEGAADPFQDYELLEEIGRGGMGVIYRARQRSLNRIVAIKTILANRLAGPEDIARFRAEAQHAAQLQHPGIVQIFEIGGSQHQEYIALEYVDGTSLNTFASSDHVLPAETAAEIVQRVAESVAYAHACGVIHRDLKPANILLARAPAGNGVCVDTEAGPVRYATKVADFGLAKRTESDTGMTVTGQILGTPSYMPPEQADGRSDLVNESADIYSLGGVLYALLTGRPPFRAASAMETLKQVLEQLPLSPRQLNPQIPRNLETICLKCLNKSPADRYLSAADLAADLRRFLNGEPIAARPAGVVERLVRWVRRRPTQASLIAASVLALMSLVAAAVGAYDSRIISEARDLAQEYLYYSRVSLADRHWHSNNAGTASDLLDRCPPEKRNWEWRYLDRLLHQELLHVEAEPDTSPLSHAHVTADGRRIICSGGGCDVWILDARTGEPLRYWHHGFKGGTCAIAASADGRGLVVLARIQSRMTSADAFYWELPDEFDGPLQPLPAPLWTAKDISTNNFAPPLLVSQDGQWIAVGSGIHRVEKRPEMAFVTLIPTAAPERAFRLTADQSLGQNGCVAAAFSPDGSLVAFASQILQEGRQADRVEQACRIEVWDTARQQRLQSLNGFAGTTLAVRFSPDGQRFAAALLEEIVVWETSGWEPTRSFPLKQSERVLDLEFRPTGSVLGAALADGTIGIFDLDGSGSDGPALRLRGHTANANSLDWFPDGRTLVSSSADGSLRVWNVERPQTYCDVGTATAGINGIAFCGDGRWIVTGDEAGFVTRWSTDGQERPVLMGRHDRAVRSVAASPDGRLVATGDGERQTSDRVAVARLWDAEQGRLSGEVQEIPTVVRALKFFPDSRRLAIGGGDFYGGDGRILLWDVTQKRTLWKKNRGNGIQDIAISPDGTRLAGLVLNVNPEIFVLDAETGGGVGAYVTDREDPERVETVRFSRNGRRLLLAGDGLRLFDYLSGTTTQLDRQPGLIHNLELLPDERMILTNSDTRTLQIWHESLDASNREDIAQQLLQISSADENVACIAVSGGIIAAGCADGSVRVWDGSARQPAQSHVVRLRVPQDVPRQ